MTGILAAEWVKLRSTRSAAWVLAVVALTVLTGAWLTHNAATAWDSYDAARRAQVRVPGMEQILLPVFQLALGVLGALAMTSEYGTGTIRCTLLAVPRRGSVLLAKALVVAAFTLTAALFAVFATFAASRAIAGDRPMPPGYTGAVADEIPLLLASSAMVVVTALMALGIGAVLRSTAAAVSVVAALLFVLPGLSAVLPTRLGGWVGGLLPSGLPAQLVAHPSRAADLPPLLALAVAGGYVLVTLGLGAVLLGRRDA